MNEQRDRNIAKKGTQLRPSEVYKIAFTAVEQAALKNSEYQIIEKYRNDEDSNNEQYFIFKKGGEHHVVIFPALDKERIDKPQIPIEKLITTLEPEIKKSIPEGTPLHKHYFICQTGVINHFVYGHEDTQGNVNIIDSLPLNPNWDHAESSFKQKGKKYDYSKTGEQFNNSDCGHYILREFFQTINLRENNNSFFQDHRKKIGFVLGMLLAGTACILAIVFSGGFAAIGIIPLVTAVVLTLGGGLVGSFWAELFGENPMTQKERNYHQNLLKDTCEIAVTGSNVWKQLSDTPEGQPSKVVKSKICDIKPSDLNKNEDSEDEWENFSNNSFSN